MGWGWNMLMGVGGNRIILGNSKAQTQTDIGGGAQNEEGWCHLASYDCFHGVAPVFFPAETSPFPFPHPEPCLQVPFHLCTHTILTTCPCLRCPVSLILLPIPTSISSSRETTQSSRAWCHSLHSLLRPPKLL